MKKFADTARRLLSIALNLFIVWAEPIALPMSWDWGKEQMFIFYTEDSNILSACICAMVADSGGSIPMSRNACAGFRFPVR